VPPGHSTSSGDSPFASAQALDAQACSEVGARLGTTRDQRRLTHADVANRLLLSTAQVKGLERADARAFHNPAFFASALRKYAALLDVDCPEAILTPKSPPNVRAGSDLESTAASKGDKKSGKKAWLAVATVVLLAGASALTLYFRGGTARPTPPAPTLPAPPPPIDRTELPLPEPLPAPAPTPAPSPPPTPSLPQPSDDGRAGIVTLARPAWVFVRYGDNSVTERTLQEGESLTLTSAPIYLAIGAGEGVTLTLRGRPIDVSPFRNGDEIRIRASELAALAP
jgi:hypothetical protein